MKKIMSLMLGMSLVLGAASVAFAKVDDTKGSSDTTKKTGKKKGSKKSSGSSSSK
jgi:hypothetical protein